MAGGPGGLVFNRGRGERSPAKGTVRRVAVAGGRTLVGLGLGIGASLLLLVRQMTRKALTLTPDQRPPLLERPEDHGRACEDVAVVAEDGLALRGWYMPGRNGATIMVMHGSPGGRQEVLAEGVFLNRHGYNVLLGSFRAHDDCDGVDISLGYRELKDILAWHRFLLTQEGVDPQRIGVLGESMGGCVAIHHAAEQADIAAVIAVSAPACMDEMLSHTLASYARAPDWSVKPLTRLMTFWGLRKLGCSIDEIDALPYAGQVSPRPLLIIHGGKDHRVPADHGRRLYEAAGEPKEYWFVPEAGHIDFERVVPVEYERRVVTFFDRYLLASPQAVTPPPSSAPLT